MKVPAAFLVSLGVLVSLTLSTEAFVVRPPHHATIVRDSTLSRSGCCTLLDAGRGDPSPSVDPGCEEAEQAAPRRRQFLAQSFQKVAVVMGAASAIASSGVASASAADVFEDLAMPTEEEQKQMQEDAMAGRIRLKAELKKKTAEPKNFADSLRGEQQKQKEMSKKTKAEQRAALCEELGRGC